MLRINAIQVEHRRIDEGETLWTDAPHPRIAFSVSSDRKGCTIRAAAVRVNGWVERRTDLGITVYQGPALEPFQAYTVEVEAEDDAGETAIAEAVFHTGRMDLPWQGMWISDGQYAVESPNSPVPMVFRKQFRTEQPAKLQIAATAMGIYQLQLDGKRITEDYFAPGFTDYKAHLQYDVYEVPELAPGEHVFTATVAGGWAVGRSTHVDDTNKSKSKLSADRQALLTELRLDYGDRTEVIGTDRSFWVTEDSPLRFADFYDGEIFRADWDFSKAIWRHAAPEKLRVSPQICARYGEKVTRQQVLEPVSVETAPSGELLYDFGQNIAGVIWFTLRGHAGQQITFRHAEALECGELYVQNLRSAKQIVQYICKDGVQTWSPRFTYMGFRYVGVRGIPAEDIHLQAIVLSSDVETIGQFRCSNEDLNQLQRNLVWSGRDNFVDIPTDCPQRDERQGWTGDIALFAPTACFNFDMARFLEKWLIDLSSEQGPTGTIPFVIPSRPGITPAITTSCWGDSCILVPWALYQSNGDKTVLERQYPSMQKFLADVQRWAALSLPICGSPYILKLPFQFGDWCAPWGSAPDWLKKDAWVGTAYFYHSCCLMAEIAGILGKAQDQKRYQELAEKVQKAFCKVLLEPDGRLKEEFQTGYVLPLAFGIGSEAQRKVMAERLWALIRDNGVHLATGFPSTPFLLFALADNGYADEAYQLLLQDADPSWLYQIRHGATTMWEQWGSIQEDGTIKESSLNHYAYGSVGNFFYRRICGLEATEPGYRTFRVQPIPGGGLTWAACSHRCPYGEIRVRWEIQDGSFYLMVHVPVGTTAAITMPDGTEYAAASGDSAFEQPYETPIPLARDSGIG